MPERGSRVVVGAIAALAAVTGLVGLAVVAFMGLLMLGWWGLLLPVALVALVAGAIRWARSADTRLRTRTDP